LTGKVVQVSVFLENKPGTLADITDVLSDGGIDLRFLTVAETGEFGILRLIVADPDSTINTLSKAGYTSVETEVVAVQIEDEPGTLNRLARTTGDAGLNIEYFYVFVVKPHKSAVAIVRSDDTEKLGNVLTAEGFKVLTPTELYSL
jgi:hypothetical protein